MSNTSDAVAKKRGRPKKIVVAPAIEKISTTASKSTTIITPGTSKKPISTTTPTPSKSPLKSSRKTNSSPASESHAAASAPIDQKPAAKKGSRARQKKTSISSPDSPQEPLETPSDSNKAKNETADVKSRSKAVASNPPTEPSIASLTPSTESKSISHTQSTELPSKQKVTGGRQPETRSTVQSLEGIEPSSGGRETIEQEQHAGQTRPANPADAGAAVKGSYILNALAASRKSTRTATSVEDKTKISGSTEPSTAAPTDMPPLARKNASSSGPRQRPSQPPPIKPPLIQTASAPREAQRPKPQQAPVVNPQDIRNTKQYKTAARRWTSVMVALPILLYTSYALYERVFADKAPRSLPGTNNFPPVSDNSTSSSPSPSSPSTPASTTMTQDNYNG
ncbi:predicted protein [Histoplasma capsulatum G186AR]|uniref:Uncharacterized protein n=2 Tax=Ajellomyces capsulatus TaxID=5037 RepID=C0NMH1_AJECG|nr:uncharacterized protein HCBG_03948 [Histoplasma capsulatum G186AR]EEH07069.1 predicted protein [Histoplasma capsulatum G186AR]KAG5287809.1 hypothetical protein I7I52_11696 [Histoplasma capsulatum]QSS70402.1 hypothetical protein I7I50_12025 [Histoplasma capsulatum G186AR]